jgi:hypothetical protein
VKFNQRQKSAFAKVLDNIGTANIIGILIGVFVDAKVTIVNGIALGIVSVLCYSYAAFLRRKENGRGDE